MPPDGVLVSEWLVGRRTLRLVQAVEWGGGGAAMAG
jgi:hypothetical protein